MARSRCAEPVRKALLAGGGDKETYGRAFGFERMMDTWERSSVRLTALASRSKP